MNIYFKKKIIKSLWGTENIFFVKIILGDVVELPDVEGQPLADHVQVEEGRGDDPVG